MNTPWVVIPTYNEKDNIAKMIHSLFNQNIPNLSILIVDDNSPDGTGQIVKNLQNQYRSLRLETREKKEGLGRAYIHGFKYSIDHGASAIVQMDADFSHDPKDVPRLLKNLQNNDLVIGSRYINGISVVNWPLSRLLISMGGNTYVRIITGMPFKDSTGGFRAWNINALKKINLSTINATGYGFQVVITHRVWKQKLKIKEIPIIFTERREGQSKMSKAIIWEAIWLVWKIRLFR
jgi:dolichol-phosphate mannosyltransferase